MRIEEPTLLLPVEEYQRRWDSQQPGTLETLTPDELARLYDELTSVPLGG